jgi:hypothetical protein
MLPKHLSPHGARQVRFGDQVSLKSLKKYSIQWGVDYKIYAGDTKVDIWDESLEVNT